MSSGALSPKNREDAIAALKATSESGKELDILIVGGGVLLGRGFHLEDHQVRRGEAGVVEFGGEVAHGCAFRRSCAGHDGDHPSADAGAPRCSPA